jgi:transcriptional regulator with XRE-family HTH domain
MLDKERFAKVLALAGSDIDGEALAAIRKARKMLQTANMSFTDIARSFGSGGRASGGESGELTRLRVRLADAEALVRNYLQEIARLRARQSGHATSLKRTRAAIEATIRAILKEEPSLSDREIARRTGLAPQTVGNWRRRLEAERASKRRTVHNGRKRTT